MRTTIGTGTAVLGIIACLAGPVLAHHAFNTEYDATKKVKLTGVVTNVAWTNPHMRVYVDVTDAKREGHELEPGADQSQFSSAPGLGKKRSQGRRQSDLRRVRGQGRRKSRLAAVDRESRDPGSPVVRARGTAGGEQSEPTVTAPGRTAALVLFATALFVSIGGGALLARASQQSSDDLDVVPVRPDFYMIAGAGGNVAVQIGPAGVVLVDTGSAQRRTQCWRRSGG